MLFGCEDQAIQTIEVIEEPMIIIDPQNFELCTFEVFEINNSSTGFDLMEWSFGDGNTSNENQPTYSFDQPGIYTLSVSASNREVCFDSLRINNAFDVKPSPIAGFTWEDRGNGMVAFTNTTTGAISYNWDFGDGNNSILSDPEHEYENNGPWVVRLSATGRNGCVSTYEEEILPAIFYGLHLPNAFSPEGGIGESRIFKPVGVGIQSYREQVFSPFGEQVWDWSELEGEAPTGAWDGYYKGQLLPQGAYVWKASATYINGKQEVKTGTVTLIR